MDRGAWRVTVRGVEESDRTEHSCTKTQSRNKCSESFIFYKSPAILRELTGRSYSLHQKVQHKTVGLHSTSPKPPKSGCMFTDHWTI